MKATAFLTIAMASSLLAPSAAAAAPAKASVAARTEISGFLNQMFTFYLRIDWLSRRSHDRARQDCHKRANHPLKCLSARQLTPDVTAAASPDEQARWKLATGCCARDLGECATRYCSQPRGMNLGLCEPKIVSED